MIDGASCRRARRLRAAGLAPVDARAEGRARAPQRHAGVDGAGARRVCSPPSARWRRRSSPARCRSMRASAATRRSTRASTRCAAIAARADAAAIYRALLAGSAIRESHKDCPRVQDPYSLRCQPQVMGACIDQMRHAAAMLADRSERGIRQSARVRGRRRDPVRRQLPRRARRVRRRQPRARDRRDRRAVRAPHRAADGREPVGPAAVPGRGRRRELRLHDRAGHRRGARLREQVARASGIGRLAADLREPGGSRQHGDVRRAPADVRWRRTRRASSRSSCSPPRRASTCGGRSRRRRRSPRRWR